jgi:HSP20 family molecular chaperone IbpA
MAMKNGERPGQDWEQFDKFMGAQLPFLPKDFLKGRMKQGGDWIGEYVQDVLKRSFSGRGGEEEGAGDEEASVSSASTGASTAASDLDYEYEAFETHTAVIVRITVPDGIHIKNVRIYAGNTQLKVEQDPSRKKLYIRLPHPVDHGAAKASFKDRVLEIRLPKLEEAEIFQEVRIRII